MKCSLPDLDLSDRLDHRCLGAPCAHTGTAAAATVASLQKTQLGLADVHEDTPVAQDTGRTCLHILLGTLCLHTFVLSTPYPPLNATQNSISSSLPLPSLVILCQRLGFFFTIFGAILICKYVCMYVTDRQTNRQTVAQDNDDERQQHADRDVEQRVVVRQGAVPETLLQLGR